MRTTPCRVTARVLATLILSGCGLIAAASPTSAYGDTPAPALPAVPDTPAGHAFESWLVAFDSGSSERIASFDRAHYPWSGPDAMVALRARTGGYALLNIIRGGKLWIIFRLQEKTGGLQVTGRLVVQSFDPQIISYLELTPTAADSHSTMLDATERDRVLEGAARLLDELYVFPDTGRKLSAALRSAEKRGAYRNISDDQIFAWRVDDDLWAIAHDGHLRVNFTPSGVPSAQPRPAPGTDAAFRQRLLATNCGFDEVEHLDPNIGYLKLDAFLDPDTCAPTAAAAMSFVANSDALIIDLRDNHGGGPMVQFIASYLFAGPTHLNDIYWRRDNAVTQAWTLPYVPGKKFIGKPVFVLTSKHTFSAAEDFCYALKNLKRATLIGETTGGGAHPIDVQRIDDHFSIVVPVGRSISPITHTDWEGTGVQPDIKVPAADALTEALKRARDLPQKQPPIDSRSHP